MSLAHFLCVCSESLIRLAYKDRILSTMFKCGTSYGLQTNAQHFFQVLMQTYSISEKDN